MPSDEQARDPQAASASGEGPDASTAATADPMPMPSDAPGNEPAMLTVAGERAVSEPIVVANTLWRSTHEAAYSGGLPPAITHLRDVELGNKRDDAPWSGALDIIP